MGNEDIKKPMILCARRDQVNRARNADHAAKTFEMFVYSIVKITRFYYRLSNMVDTFTNTYEVHKGMWVSFLLIIYASARSF